MIDSSQLVAVEDEAIRFSHQVEYPAPEKCLSYSGKPVHATINSERSAVHGFPVMLSPEEPLHLVNVVSCRGSNAQSWMQLKPIISRVLFLDSLVFNATVPLSAGVAMTMMFGVIYRKSRLKPFILYLPHCCKLRSRCISIKVNCAALFLSPKPILGQVLSHLVEHAKRASDGDRRH